jgi:hypothetical protein
MSGGHGGPWEGLRGATRRVRREAVAAVALTALALVPVVLLVAWAVGDRWAGWSAGPLALVLGAVLVGGGVVVLLRRRWVWPVTESAIAAAAERRHGLAEGSIRGILELARGLPPGSSAALYRRTEQDLATRLEGASTADLAGDVGERSRDRRTGVLAVAIGLAVLASLAGFAVPERARDGWTPLLHPVVHLRGPALAPLTVSPGDAEVARGESLMLEVGAPLRSQVTLEWRAPGQVPGGRDLPVLEGSAAGALGPVQAPLEYRVRAPDGAATRWFRVEPVDPLLLAGLAVDVVYPAHVGRAPERVEGETAPALAIPEGTLLRVRGAATRRLEGAVFRRDGSQGRPATTSGRDFALDWRPGRDAAGTWELELRDGTGETARSITLALTILRDAPPRVRILLPGVDTVLSATRRQGVVAEAVDDHGLTGAELVYRRVGARGHTGPTVRIPLPLPADAGDRARLRAVLDVSAEPLVPGDAVEYHVEVRDNSPAGQVGRSERYRLRLPSAADLREQARSDARELLREAGRAADRARELERAGRELSRRVAADGRAAGSGGAGAAAEESSGLDFRRAAEARQLADAHDEARRELAELRRRLEQLRDVAGDAGLRDRDLDARLEQLADLYRDLAPADPDREAASLREAADALDRAGVGSELERLLANQDELRQRLEESLELLREAALDQEMVALAREAEEIAAQQEVLAAAMRDELGRGEPSRVPSPNDQAPGEPGAERAPEGEPGAGDPERDGGADGADSGGDGGGSQGDDLAESRSRQQEELGARTARLNELIESLQQQLFQRGDDQSASQAGSAQEQGRSAQQSMEQAAEQARQQQGDEAAASGEHAAGQLSSAARSLDEARGQRSESARQEAQAAVRQATQDALRLAEREEALRQQMAESQAGGAQGGAAGGGERQQMQSEQLAVQQGLQQLGRNLSEAGQAGGMLDREVAQALARAMLDLEHTLDGLQSGGRMPVQEAGQAVESLNRLAMALLHAEDRARRSSDPGLAELLRRLTEVAREQGALNAQAGALAPLEIEGRSQSEQVQQLAEQQRGVARRVGEVSGLLGGREDVLGRLDPLSAEAAAIARELDGGRLDPEVRARQERLFHRLLDAGRSMEREEYTEERAGRAAEARSAGSPDPLEAGLLDSALRYPGPSARQLRELPSAYRRLVLEYFERINAGAEAATEPAPNGGRP